MDARTGFDVIYSDESPVFAIIFGVAPALSGLAWTWRRNSPRLPDVP